MTPYEFEGRKYEYSYDIEEEEDNRKIFHNCLITYSKGVTESTHIDWTPYDYITQLDFELWVRVGMPTRLDNDNCNFNSQYLTLYAKME